MSEVKGVKNQNPLQRPPPYSSNAWAELAHFLAVDPSSECFWGRRCDLNFVLGSEALAKNPELRKNLCCSRAAAPVAAPVAAAAQKPCPPYPGFQHEILKSPRCPCLQVSP